MTFRALAVVWVSLCLLAGPFPVTARAAGPATSVAVAGNLAKDGTLTVRETVTFTGGAPTRLVQKFETAQDVLGDRRYVQTLSDVTAAAGGAPLVPDVQVGDRFTTVTVSTRGADEVVVGYVVRGAVVSTDTGTALRWPLLQGLDVGVTSFRGTVAVPGLFSYIRCTAGSPNATTPCTSAAAGTEQAQTPTVTDGPRGPGEVVAIDLGFPPGTVASNERVEHRWTLGRAFSPTPLPLGLAVGLLVLGGIGLIVLHRRVGTDAAYGGAVAPVGEFVPTGAGESEFRVVGDVRPGHVGTVADERVDPIDVVATLVDLAVRGHLVITELPRESAFAPTEWTLTRVGDGRGLRPFEQALLGGVAPPDDTVRVSQLAGRVHESIAGVQDALYDEVVANGWYERRPDATRNRYTRGALVVLVVAVLATGLLAAFTTFGLVGLALVLLGLGLIFVAQELPSRTAKGVALLKGLGALRSELMSHPTDQMPPGQAVAELSEVLPYAIVLGGSERWLDALVGTDRDDEPDPEDLSWYHGPADWQLADLPRSLQNFLTTVSGTLFTR